MRERMLVRAAVAGFAVGVMGLAAVAVTSGGDSPSRLPALSLGGAEQDKAAAPGSRGTIEYRVRATLANLAGHARTWRLGRNVEVERVEALARAFGLDAPATVVADGWTVSAGGRVLRVERQPGAPWYFSPSAGETGCVAPAVEPGAPPVPPDTPVSSDARCAAAEPIVGPKRPAGLPTREQAEVTARAMLAKAGIDVERAVVRVDDGFSQWLVQFDPRVGPLPTYGFGTDVSVGPEGVIDAHGWLAPPEKSDEYPLATTAAGFERLKASPFGIGPQPLIAQAPIACDAITGCPEPAPIVRTVTGVRLGLAFVPLADPGADALLVPVFLFDIEDGGIVVPVLALDDDFLPQPAEGPKPSTGPAPSGTAPAVEAPGRGGGTESAPR